LHSCDIVGKRDYQSSLAYVTVAITVCNTDGRNAALLNETLHFKRFTVCHRSLYGIGNCTVREPYIMGFVACELFVAVKQSCC